jgi:hypothetical protein
MDALLRVCSGTIGKLVAHLLPRTARSEEAAFGFAKPAVSNERLCFDLLDWLPIEPTGFAHRSAYYLELTDETRQMLIKRAHDLGASLIEFHSHPLAASAEFSPSDFSGFREFVPHLLWRLKDRPYAAFVFARSSFDGLAWSESVHVPIRVAGIEEGGQVHSPTGRSFRSISGANNVRSL